MSTDFWHPEAETLSRAALEKLQLGRLREELRRCYLHTDFYRQKFDAAGVRPDDLRSLADLGRLPFTRKQELREAQARWAPFGNFSAVPSGDWRELHPSTGTTGAPVYTVWSARDQELIRDFTARSLWTAGVRPGDVIHNAFRYGLWVAGLAVHYAAQELGCFIIPAGTDSMKVHLELLVNARPTVLFATPSFALALIDALRARGMKPDDLNLRLGLFGGEPGAASGSVRGRIEEGLGLTALDIFGLAEIAPTMAAECPFKLGLHWAEDHHLVEIVDPISCEPCAPGKLGVLVLTDLTRDAMPMIRYWTGDLAVLDTTPCPCGRAHARSPGGITGRLDDLVIYRGGKFYPVQVETVLRRYGELAAGFRIVLDRDPVSLLDQCTVLAEAAGAGWRRELLARKLRAELLEELGVEVEVRLVEPGEIGDSGFKARRVDDRRY